MSTDGESQTSRESRAPHREKLRGTAPMCITASAGNAFAHWPPPTFAASASPNRAIMPFGASWSFARRIFRLRTLVICLALSGLSAAAWATHAPASFYIVPNDAVNTDRFQNPVDAATTAID